MLWFGHARTLCLKHVVLLGSGRNCAKWSLVRHLPVLLAPKRSTGTLAPPLLLFYIQLMKRVACSTMGFLPSCAALQQGQPVLAETSKPVNQNKPVFTLIVSVCDNDGQLNSMAKNHARKHLSCVLIIWWFQGVMLRAILKEVWCLGRTYSSWPFECSATKQTQWCSTSERIIYFPPNVLEMWSAAQLGGPAWSPPAAFTEMAFYTHCHSIAQLLIESLTSFSK